MVRYNAKKSTHSRPDRECDGWSTTDSILKHRFVGNEVQNVPYAPTNWEEIHYKEKTGMQRELYFRITEIVFMYNNHTQFLEAQFKYTVLTPLFEQLDDGNFGTVWRSVC
jgi:hypothetical protein